MSSPALVARLTGISEGDVRKILLEIASDLRDMRPEALKRAGFTRARAEELARMYTRRAMS